MDISESQSIITDLDIFSEEEQKKQRSRAQKYNIKNENSLKEWDSKMLIKRQKRFGDTTKDIVDCHDSNLDDTPNLPTTKCSYEWDTLYFYGNFDKMNSFDVKKYFQGYGCSQIKWMNDCSCKVVFPNEQMAKRALLCLSVPTSTIDEEEYKKNKEELSGWRMAVQQQISKVKVFQNMLLRYASNEDIKLPRKLRNPSRWEQIHGRRPIPPQYEWPSEQDNVKLMRINLKRKNRDHTVETLNFEMVEDTEEEEKRRRKRSDRFGLNKIEPISITFSEEKRTISVLDDNNDTTGPTQSIDNSQSEMDSEDDQEYKIATNNNMILPHDEHTLQQPQESMSIKESIFEETSSPSMDGQDTSNLIKIDPISITFSDEKRIISIQDDKSDTTLPTQSLDNSQSEIESEVDQKGINNTNLSFEYTFHQPQEFLTINESIIKDMDDPDIELKISETKKEIKKDNEYI